MKATITSIKRRTNISTGEDFFDVSIGLEDGSTKKFGYPITTTKKEIMNDIKKLTKLKDLEAEVDEQNKERDAIDKQAQKTMNDLVGATI